MTTTTTSTTTDRFSDVRQLLSRAKNVRLRPLPGAPRFDAVPASTSSAPAESFISEDEARRWAEDAAREHGVPFDVWAVVAYRGRIVARFDPR